MKIMKKNILFGVVCVALLTATSCSDFLDVQPEGDARDNAYFLNDQQAIDAVDGLYERFHQEAMYGRELGTFIKYYKISQLIHTQSIAN